MTHLVFSHGNSFPAGTYNVLFEHLRARGFEVSAVDRFGHDPRYPVTSNWPHLVQQLADFAQEQVQRAGAPVFLVGHSLGGILSVMAAAQHPGLARGVLMLDSPLVSGWRATTVGVPSTRSWWGGCRPGVSAASAAPTGPAAPRHWSTFARRKPLPAGTRRRWKTT